MRDILAPGRKPSNFIGLVFRSSSFLLFFFASGLHGISLTRATAISVPTFVLLLRTWTMQFRWFGRTNVGIFDR